jgi:hypothetical protein
MTDKPVVAVLGPRISGKSISAARRPPSTDEPLRFGVVAGHVGPLALPPLKPAARVCGALDAPADQPCALAPRPLPCVVRPYNPLLTRKSHAVLPLCHCCVAVGYLH